MKSYYSFLAKVVTIAIICIGVGSCTEGPDEPLYGDEDVAVLVNGPNGQPMIDQEIAIVFAALSRNAGASWNGSDVLVTDNKGYIRLPLRNFDYAVLDNGDPRFWHRYFYSSFIDPRQYFITRPYKTAIQAYPKYHPSEDVKDVRGETDSFSSDVFTPQDILDAGDFVAFSGQVAELSGNGFTEWECLVRFVPVDNIPDEVKTEQLKSSIESTNAYGVMQLWLRMPDGFRASMLYGNRLPPGALKEGAISGEVLVAEALVADLDGIGIDFQWFTLLIRNEKESGGVTQRRVSGWLRTWGEEDEEQWKVKMTMSPRRFNSNGFSLIPLEKLTEPEYTEVEDSEIE